MSNKATASSQVLVKGFQPAKGTISFGGSGNLAAIFSDQGVNNCCIEDEKGEDYLTEAAEGMVGEQGPPAAQAGFDFDRRSLDRLEVGGHATFSCSEILSNLIQEMCTGNEDDVKFL